MGFWSRLWNGEAPKDERLFVVKPPPWAKPMGQPVGEMTATASDSIAIGRTAVASGTNSVAIGSNATVTRRAR